MNVTALHQSIVTPTSGPAMWQNVARLATRAMTIVTGAAVVIQIFCTVGLIEFGIAFMMVMLLAGFQALPTEVFEAA